ncbi:hypothetical protein METP2_03331 [Methanosarcinales archaeon]|nr:hypothetical protein [Candidatus Methanoperedens sp.]CAG1001789.1 hypothetical protein METP2_03331 [Methanosarcinales archaeon]
MGIEENKAQSLEILTITFWTDAIVSTGFLATKLNLRFWHIILYIVMVYVFVFFWLKGVWKANEKDKIWASVYKSRIDAEINIIPIGSIEEYEEPESCGFYKDWSMGFKRYLHWHYCFCVGIHYIYFLLCNLALIISGCFLDHKVRSVAHWNTYHPNLTPIRKP